MKINGPSDGSRPYPVDKTRDAKPGSRAAEAAAGESRDRLELSADARRIATLVEAANRLPEIREERVAELSQAIRRGVYEVEPRALARSILEFEDALG